MWQTLAPPAFALLDLSVVDSRFGPPLAAAELAHHLEAWQGAVVGSEAPREELAAPRPEEHCSDRAAAHDSLCATLC